MTRAQEESISMIVTSGALLMAIVNDVLDYSKLGTDNVVIDTKRNSLQELLCTVVQSIEMKSQCTQSVKPFFDAYLPEFVHMDSRRLQQVLFNLLGNALKFSPYNGVVEFSVQMVKCPTESSGEGINDGVTGLVTKDSLTVTSLHSTFDLPRCPFEGTSDTRT